VAVSGVMTGCPFEQTEPASAVAMHHMSSRRAGGTCADCQGRAGMSAVMLHSDTSYSLLLMRVCLMAFEENDRVIYARHCPESPPMIRRLINQTAQAVSLSPSEGFVESARAMKIKKIIRYSYPARRRKMRAIELRPVNGAF
jgi:hypothetical protein